MKTFSLLATFFAALFCVAQTNLNHVNVRGYYRNDGTYVAPHYRTAPNSTVNDNFTTVGNVNPYTGEAGNLPRESVYYPNITYTEEFTDYYRANPIEALVIPSHLGSGEIPLYKEPKHKTHTQEKSIYEPMMDIKPRRLWNTDKPKKPSFVTYNTDIGSKYDRQPNGNYKLKGSTDYSGVYLTVGVAFLGLLALVFKVKP